MKHMLDIKAVNKYKHKPSTEDREFKELDFSTMPQKLHGEYMDVYEGIQSEIVSSNRFDENSNLSTTYLGRVNKENKNKLRAEESFPISEHGYTSGRLLGGTECQLLLDTGASKSFMSKSFYMQCKSLHSLPKFASRTQRIQVGNGQCVSVLFIIPVIIVLCMAVHTDQYLQWDCHHNLACKYSVINTLTHRAKAVCSISQLLKEELKHLEGALTQCKYPRWAFQKILRIKKERRTREKKETYPYRRDVT